jgi:hypothetical protein
MGNFAAVIDYIADALILAIDTNRTIGITPILLVGGQELASLTLSAD